ncbi:hypoxanthine phosphoribosyltransferase [Chloropicon primus]|uniref:Hypoxanthine phosphoribosyltransferase n=1 Tax=Chloropicon primus TaxID=1764295 RepID=A0A5B8MQ14_9CHLO|nr:hypoxanthine phosphoribosyltransferase [Chloropicon primus]UPR01992.1 hypoxanthine phosphoribosyltransferase [Chloropicon primus]|mmetsp:Transcript_8434/g.24106  ORF Transcript_8434/g.24106 Transcript_8434/m.24106 type:complete len:199 (-) Transcript_8434:41-637(-)|eukprot:QDZ22768.1 hypoxanthine phosphoribosyltransferase [Chloropicon primus]
MEGKGGGNGLNKDVADVLYSRDAISKRVSALGKEIAEDFKGKRPLIVGILKGCFMFFSDLCKEIDPVPDGCEVHFAKARSYEGNTCESNQSVKLTFLGGEDEGELIRGRHVVLVEDIVDTGNTLKAMLGALKGLGAKSVTVATFLDKKCRRTVPDLELGYVGFECPDAFVIGYGMDYGEKYRTLPYVGVLKEDVYQTS